MITVFSFLGTGTQREGVFVLLLLLTAVAALANWALWMFGLGRFKGPQPDSSIRFVSANFFVRIINDFRHFPALVMVILFGLALLSAMWPGMMKQDVGLI